MILESELQKEVRAISFKQPYADLILRGKQETRTRPTSYRGIVLIAASKKMYNQAEVFNISGIPQEKRICDLYDAMNEKPYQLKGVAIGVARLVNCRPMVKADEDSTFVKFYPDLFVWEFQDATPIIPFAWTGTQGWKVLSPEYVAKIDLMPIKDNYTTIEPGEGNEIEIVEVVSENYYTDLEAWKIRRNAAKFTV